MSREVSGKRHVLAMIWPAFTNWGVEDTWRWLCGGGNGPNKEAEFLEESW